MRSAARSNEQRNKLLLLGRYRHQCKRITGPAVVANVCASAEAHWTGGDTTGQQPQSNSGPQYLRITNKNCIHCDDDETKWKINVVTVGKVSETSAV